MTIGSRRFRGSLILGLLIIIAGVLLLLERVTPESGIDFATYWPVLIIAFGLFKILQYTDFRNLLSAAIITLVGTGFLLDRLGIIYMKDLWPVALIVIGIMFIAGTFWRPARCCGFSRHHRRTRDKNASDSVLSNRTGELSNNQIDINTVLGGGEYKVTSKQFRGGEINSVLGSVEIDFRECEIESESAVLEANAVMGSIVLFLPTHWDVHLEGTPVMGSVENKASIPRDAKKKIIVSANAVMGSVEIKN